MPQDSFLPGSVLPPAPPAPPDWKTPTAGGPGDSVAGYVMRLMETAKRARNLVDQQWPLYYRMFRGNHWQFKPKQEWRAQVTVNYVNSIIESAHSVLTDTEPRLAVVPTSPHQQNYCTTLQAAIDNIWYRARIGQKGSQSIKNSLIYGNGYLKVWYDPDANDGMGEICVDMVPTENIWVDPEGCEIHEDMEFVMEARPQPLSYLRRKYKKGHLVRPDITRPAGGKLQERRYDMATPWQFVTPINLGGTTIQPSATDMGAPSYMGAPHVDKDWALLIECWVRDYSKKVVTELVDRTDPTTGMSYQEENSYEVSAYPSGWRLIHVAGGITLDDQPSDYPPPYVVFHDNKLPGEFYSQGEVEKLKDLQLELNKRRSQMVDHAALMGNAVWIVDHGSLVDPKMVASNKPGMIVQKAPGSEVRREAAPQMPSYHMELTQITQMDMEKMSGVGPIPSGLAPRGVRSGHGFEIAQEIGTIRLRNRAKNIEQAYSDLGRLLIRFIQLYYTTPRIIRIMGDPGNVTWISFNGKTIRGDWDVKVEIGDKLPTTKAAQSQQAIQLFQLGAIDQLTLLRRLGFSDAEEIAKNMQQAAMSQYWYPGHPGPPMLDPGAGLPNGLRMGGEPDQAASIRNSQQFTIPPAPEGPGAQ